MTLHNSSCSNGTDTSATFTSLLTENNALKSFIFILGISTVLVNLVTVTVVFSSPKLRRISTIFLAGHIAVCDFFVGLFLLVVAVLAFDYEQKRYIDSSKRYVCPVMISLRAAALAVEPLLLFLMTLDRYKRIVNHSKPPLSRLFITLTTYFSWLISGIVVGIGSVISFTREENFGSLCAQFNLSRQTIDFYIEMALIATSAILFISSCIMYFRIYRVVRTQNQRMGTQTYVRVAKLIFAVLLSTMVLWYVPAIAVAFFGRKNTGNREVRILTILIAFTTNSLVNPFLYVLREKKFHQEISSSSCCRRTRRRRNPSDHRKNSFRVYEIAMTDVKDDQTSTNCCNSDETQEGYSTSL